MKNNFVKNIFRQNILNKNQTKHKLKEICIHWLLRNWNNPQIKRKVFFFFFFEATKRKVGSATWLKHV